MAAICLLLASKSEDTACSLNKIIVLSYELMYKKEPAYAHRIYQKQVFETQKSLILSGERLLLSTICFDVNVEHPYRPLIEACTKFGYTGNRLMKTAWDFVNDWLRSTLCLQYKPHYIAAGSLSLAAKLHEVKLPSANGYVWWHEFEVAPRQLAEVIREMTELLCHKRAVESQKLHEPVQFWLADRNNDIISNGNADSQKHQKAVQNSPLALRNDDFSSPESCVLSRPGSTSNTSSQNTVGVTCGAQQGVSTNLNSSCDKRSQDNKTSMDYHRKLELQCRAGGTEGSCVVEDCQSSARGNDKDSNNNRVLDQHSGSLSKADRNGFGALVKNLSSQNESIRRIYTGEQKNAGTCTASALESVVDLTLVPLYKKRRIGL